MGNLRLGLVNLRAEKGEELMPLGTVRAIKETVESVIDRILPAEKITAAHTHVERSRTRSEAAIAIP